MKRRNFLQLSALSALLLLTPKDANAYEYKPYSGPLWIFIECIGGWDTTLLCNHQPTLNRLPQAQVKKKVGNIEYVGLSDKVDNFFSEHYQDLLVINGLSSQTNSHGAGNVNLLSGRLERGFPTFGALINSAYRLDSPVGHILTEGGYRFSANLANTTVVRSGGNIVSLTSFDKDYKGESYLPQSITQKLEAAKIKRLERLLQKHSSEAIKESISSYTSAKKSTTQLEALVPYLSQGITNTNPKYQGGMYQSTHVGIAAYKANKMCLVINSRSAGARGGMDTHTVHDTQHPLCIDAIVEQIDAIVEDLKLMGVYDDTVIVVGSDMGRTPTYNKFDGKDHWPITSMLLLGGRVQGNQMIGATTENLLAKKIDAQTLDVVEDDAQGIELSYPEMHQLFRRYSNVDTLPASLKYDLKAQKLPLERFFKV